jgi:hypothetical protein
MGKYDRFQESRAKPKPVGVHPVWRGIGCLLMLIIPVISYAGAMVFLQANRQNGWIRMPAELAVPLDLRLFVLPITIIELLVTILFLLALVLVVMIIYSMTYRMAGPSRYGPTDAPPPRRKSSPRR